MRQIFALILMVSLLAACQTTQTQNTAAMGTLAGATVGALTANNKIAGAAIGAGAGLLLGYIVGNEMEKMDKYDSRQVARTLESEPSGHTTAWVNPDTHIRYEATPKPARMKPHGRIERDVTLRAKFADGHKRTVHAKAYRRDDGTWQLIGEK